MLYPDDPQREAWYENFLRQQQANLAQQLQVLHRLQPWQQPANARFQNPLVGSDAANFIDRPTDTAPAMMAYFTGAQDDGSQPINPMLEQMILSGGL